MFLIQTFRIIDCFSNLEYNKLSLPIPVYTCQKSYGDVNIVVRKGFVSKDGSEFNYIKNLFEYN
jgi:hypothetical protein